MTTSSGNANANSISTPWVEKYRPSNFDDIVLDPLNKLMLRNIIATRHFPNLLFYGPPGTGKTTTIINLVNEYQRATMQHTNGGFMIHLNASDERGIDIIRNQINSFVTTQSLFGTGTKFVILDEVDYMTKNAQTALRYLLNSYNYSQHNVRFCLICNYISRIDEALQTEFVRLRFNQLPVQDIIQFMRKVSAGEGLHLSDQIIMSIQKQFNSDIRSMINYMQTNQDAHSGHLAIATETNWDEITADLKKGTSVAHVQTICEKLKGMSHKCNLDRKHMIKIYANHIMRREPDLITPELLNKLENVMHANECNVDHIMQYVVSNFAKCFGTSARSQSIPTPIPTPIP
jgi:replication factor C subunit 3/5